MKIVELTNRIEPDEVAHFEPQNEPPHLDIPCLPSLVFI